MDWKLEGMFGKPWFKSLTAWGLVLWAGIPTMLDYACATNLLDAVNCAALQAALVKVGGVLSVIGLRKAPVDIAKLILAAQVRAQSSMQPPTA